MVLPQEPQTYLFVILFFLEFSPFSITTYLERSVLGIETIPVSWLEC